MGSEPADVSQMCRDLLSTAVSEMGGQERPGQVAMAKAVDQAMRDKLHLLVQGAGRLIRRADDRGVVAVLDPRLVTARYGNFLRASMPPFWTTTDREMAVGALRRLGE